MASATKRMDMDITKLPEMEFTVTMVKMMCRLEKNINENIKENIESLRVEMRANLAEIKNAMNQMQSKLDVLKARVNEAEKRISELDDEMIQKKEKEGTWLKKLQFQEFRIWEITDSIKHYNVRIICIPEGVEKERGLEEIFE